MCIQSPEFITRGFNIVKRIKHISLRVAQADNKWYVLKGMYWDYSQLAIANRTHNITYPI